MHLPGLSSLRSLLSVFTGRLGGGGHGLGGKLGGLSRLGEMPGISSLVSPHPLPKTLSQDSLTVPPNDGILTPGVGSGLGSPTASGGSGLTSKLETAAAGIAGGLGLLGAAAPLLGALKQGKGGGSGGGSGAGGSGGAQGAGGGSGGAQGADGSGAPDGADSTGAADGSGASGNTAAQQAADQVTSTAFTWSQNSQDPTATNNFNQAVATFEQANSGQTDPAAAKADPKNAGVETAVNDFKASPSATTGQALRTALTSATSGAGPTTTAGAGGQGAGSQGSGSQAGSGQGSNTPPPPTTTADS